jgi:deoxyribonuclease-4
MIYNKCGGDNMLIIGSHVNFGSKEQLLGSLNQALSYGANTFMFYTGAPQNTMRNKIDDDKSKEAKKIMSQKNMNIEDIIVHAPYIINLANNKEPIKYDFSINFLKEEIKRCNQIGIKYLVLHPGSHVGLGEDIAIENIIFALNKVNEDNDNIVILLETMAGKGTEVGVNFNQIKKIINGVKDKSKIGVCLDTCHLNDAGYDVSDFDKILDEFDSIVGLSYVHCIHINDSKNPIGSHKDRHENIGYGTIGFDNLINVIYNERLGDIPRILETPYVNEVAPYKFEIENIRKKEFNDFKKML